MLSRYLKQIRGVSTKAEMTTLYRETLKPMIQALNQAEHRFGISASRKAEALELIKGTGLTRRQLNKLDEAISDRLGKIERGDIE